MNNQQITKKGFSLVELVVASALLALVFVGIAGVFSNILNLTFHNKAKLSALSVMNEEMEFVRNFDYDSIGTIGGIPSGNIQQVSSVFLNNVNYTRRIFIKYVDSPQDGLGVNDTNGITADYKVVKVEVSWNSKGKTEKISSVSTFVPKGIETVSGGGTLLIKVINSVGAPVVGANVSIKNDTLSPQVSVNTFTNIDGKVVFPGSPAGSSYNVIVTKNGYSTAKTYNADSTNTNPDPGYLSVVKSKTTTATFQIDVLSSKTVKTYNQVEPAYWQDLFDDTTKISKSASTTVSYGVLGLTQNTGVYDSSGYVYSLNVLSSYLNKWQKISWNDTKPMGTSIIYKVYYDDGAGKFSLVPDADLAGNSVGFNSSPIDISGLDISKYSSIKIAGFLSTTDTSKTPTIADWKISYLYGPVPLPNLAFNMTGSKTIGSDASGAPIYKYSQNLQTNTSGILTINPLEWDTYNITIDNANLGLDIGESCNPQPLSLPPSASATTSLYFVPHTTNSLLVAVRDSSNNLLGGVSVRLYKTGIGTTNTTSSCGRTIFSGISAGSVSNGTSYSIDLSASGYTNTTITGIDVSGSSKIDVVIN